MSNTHRNRTPSLLEPHLALPPENSLILLTSTLSCSINWLLARFASTALTQPPEEGGASVLLVSWMRDAAFWKDELRRAAGIDTSRSPYSSRYTFIDCFSSALSSNPSDPPSSQIANLEKTIASALKPDTRTILLLDTPTTMLPLTPSLTPQHLHTLFLTLRSHPSVHSTVLSTLADGPFLPQVSEALPTPLETGLAGFVTQQAHLARCVMSVRMLDSGAARDASGVLRITRGGRADDKEGGEDVKELEQLYLVGRDGGVKVVE